MAVAAILNYENSISPDWMKIFSLNLVDRCIIYTTLFHHKYDMVVEKQAKTSNK